MVPYFVHFLVRIWEDNIQRKTPGLVAAATSLRRAIPNFDDFRADPAFRLRGKSIVIGPEATFGHLIRGILLGFFGGFLAMVLTLAVFSIKLRAHDTGLKVGMLAGAVTFLGTMLGVTFLRPRGWCLLHEKGVEFRTSGETISCPWALFNSYGLPFVPPKRWLVVIPISPDALHEVLQSRGDTLVASGGSVRGRQLEIRFGKELLLRSIYEVDPEELANLLLALGRALGADNRSTPEKADYPSTAIQTEPRPGSSPAASQRRTRWITVSPTRLQFPSGCCRCGSATSNTKSFDSGDGKQERFTVFVPCCPGCIARLWEHAVGGFVLGALPGLAIVGALVVWISPDVLCVAPFVVAIPAFLGMRWMSPPLLKVSYDVDHAIAHLRFQDRDYAEKVRHMSGGVYLF
jgi:hypothetical protein